MSQGKILLVDDEENILNSLEGILSDEGYEITKADSGHDALKLLQTYSPDLILLDIWLPGMDGLQTLHMVKEYGSDAEIVIMSGHANVDSAVKATKLGAFDFIEKPFSMEKLLLTVDRAIQHKQSFGKSGGGHSPRGPQRVETILGTSPGMRQVARLLKQEAPFTHIVLVQGEDGTGKEFCAQFLHNHGPLQKTLFRNVRCWEEGEDEFGKFLKRLTRFEKGWKNPDRPQKKNSYLGTLYLAGVDQMKEARQKSLLKAIRSLEELDRQRDGQIPLARWVFSASRDLSEMVRKGEFLKELFDLISEHKIVIPPIRERREDVPVVAAYFLQKFSEEFGKPGLSIDEDAVQLLCNQDWQGNVQEIKEITRHLVLAAQSHRVTLEDTWSALASGTPGGPATQPEKGLRTVLGDRSRQRGAILSSLKKSRWDVPAAASDLNLETKVLEEQMRRLGIRRPEPGGSSVSRQRTLRESAVLCGQGLHSGMKTGLILSPMPPNSGILFKHISSGTTVPALLDFVESTGYATTLKNQYTTIKTIEHVMSVLHMYRIGNLLIKVGDEVPIMDGSALDFCRLVERVGVAEQDDVSGEIVVREKLSVGNPEDETQKSLILEPADRFIVRYNLEYPAPVGRQYFEFEYKDEEYYREEIAPARTFGFVKDVKKFEEMGLVSGGKLSNVILVDDEKVVNAPLRFENEFVRHKILDIIGDFYLLGKPVRGLVTARMSGHTENIALLKKLQSCLQSQAPLALPA